MQDFLSLKERDEEAFEKLREQAHKAKWEKDWNLIQSLNARVDAIREEVTGKKKEKKKPYKRKHPENSIEGWAEDCHRFGKLINEASKLHLCENCEGLYPEQDMILISKEIKRTSDEAIEKRIETFPNSRMPVFDTMVSVYKCPRCGSKDTDTSLVSRPKEILPIDPDVDRFETDDMVGTRLLAPSDPSTYKFTDEEWKEVCKKDGFTAEEIMESSRRNGVWSLWSKDIYVSSAMDKK